MFAIGRYACTPQYLSTFPTNPLLPKEIGSEILSKFSMQSPQSDLIKKSSRASTGVFDGSIDTVVISGAVVSEEATTVGNDLGVVGDDRANVGEKNICVTPDFVFMLNKQADNLNIPDDEKKAVIKSIRLAEEEGYLLNARISLRKHGYNQDEELKIILSINQCGSLGEEAYYGHNDLNGALVALKKHGLDTKQCSDWISKFPEDPLFRKRCVLSYLFKLLPVAIDAGLSLDETVNLYIKIHSLDLYYDVMDDAFHSDGLPRLIKQLVNSGYNGSRIFDFIRTLIEVGFRCKSESLNLTESRNEYVTVRNMKYYNDFMSPTFDVINYFLQEMGGSLDLIEFWMKSEFFKNTLSPNVLLKHVNASKYSIRKITNELDSHKKAAQLLGVGNHVSAVVKLYSLGMHDERDMRAFLGRFGLGNVEKQVSEDVVAHALSVAEFNKNCKWRFIDQNEIDAYLEFSPIEEIESRIPLEFFIGLREYGFDPSSQMDANVKSRMRENLLVFLKAYRLAGSIDIDDYELSREILKVAAQIPHMNAEVLTNVMELILDFNTDAGKSAKYLKMYLKLVLKVLDV